MGVAKQQSDLKRSFSQIYQIDLRIFVDRSVRSEQVEKESSLSNFLKQQTVMVGQFFSFFSWEMLRQGCKLSTYHNAVATAAAITIYFYLRCVFHNLAKVIMDPYRGISR